MIHDVVHYLKLFINEAKKIEANKIKWSKLKEDNVYKKGEINNMIQCVYR